MSEKLRGTGLMRVLVPIMTAASTACARTTAPAATATPQCGSTTGNVHVVCELTPHHLPFTAAEDRDGSRFVAYSEAQAGVPYRLTRTQDVPKDSQFTEVAPDSARTGDIAWWFRFMSVYYGKAAGTVEVYPGIQVRLDSLSGRLGPARFYRIAAPRAH